MTGIDWLRLVRECMMLTFWKDLRCVVLQDDMKEKDIWFQRDTKDPLQTKAINKTSKVFPFLFGARTTTILTEDWKTPKLRKSFFLRLLWHQVHFESRVFSAMHIVRLVYHGHWTGSRFRGWQPRLSWQHWCQGRQEVLQLQPSLWYWYRIIPFLRAASSISCCIKRTLLFQSMHHHKHTSPKWRELLETPCAISRGLEPNCGRRKESAAASSMLFLLW